MSTPIRNLLETIITEFSKTNDAAASVEKAGGSEQLIDEATRDSGTMQDIKALLETWKARGIDQTIAFADLFAAGVAGAVACSDIGCGVLGLGLRILGTAAYKNPRELEQRLFEAISVYPVVR
jgi:hypothetical protein